MEAAAFECSGSSTSAEKTPLVPSQSVSMSASTDGCAWRWKRRGGRGHFLLFPFFYDKESNSKEKKTVKRKSTSGILLVNFIQPQK